MVRLLLEAYTLGSQTQQMPLGTLKTPFEYQ